MRLFLVLVFLTIQLHLSGQPLIDSIQIEKIPQGTTHQYWLRLLDNEYGQAIQVPVIIVKGSRPGPLLGITAAIHGNELNGIAVIHGFLEQLKTDSLRGSIIAIPGLNSVSIPLNQRYFIDGTDLNRIFPGKASGNRSQQMVYQINQKLLPHFDFLIDMHTASFGRENSLYIRGDLNDPTIEKMAIAHPSDIILKNKGTASIDNTLAVKTLRAEAMSQGIPCITVEYGNPQIFQPEMIKRGIQGVFNILKSLDMMEGDWTNPSAPVVCKRSYWIYTNKGGYMEMKVSLKQTLKKGDLIANLRDPFGTIIDQYFCPEDGIVIGRSSNPVNMSGGRIIHLGILE